MAEYVTVWVEDLPDLKRGERIVRCRDCKHYDEIIHACDHPNVTKLRGDCPENWIFSCFDNDFCCWGREKGERMSITDELRTVAAKTECANGRCEKLYRGDLDRIADRIDAEHESACAEAYGNGVMSVPIALDESAWVKLPVDADGVSIHVGDVMEYTDKPTEPLNVSYIELEENGWWVFTGGVGRRPDKYRHHHEPTVEGVLDEMLQRFAEDSYDGGLTDFIAEYAKRLTLAESEDA